MLRNGAYAKTLPERFGFLPRQFCKESSGAIWIHAVSIGEVFAAGTVIRRLLAEAPDGRGAPVFLSATTLAGYATARERLGNLVEGCFYAPLDYAGPVRRVLRTIQPSLVVVLETEIWPNLFREVKRAGCGLIITNGRISDRAFSSYRKHR